LLQFEIVTAVNALVMHRMVKYFITFTPQCWLWQPSVPNSEQYCWGPIFKKS